MRFYNTLTRQKEEFKPLREGKVGIYVCGITAYDSCHIGHARSALVFDMLGRYLRWRGFKVDFVKNFTDIDDKIINRANGERVTISDIAQRYIAEHNRDMDALGVLRPTIAPLATEHIGAMLSLIELLITKGFAYEISGDVYFSVESFAGYGKLSGRNPEEMLAGARVEIGEKKKNPLDFALWKASKENEPWWESPWGKGRPGWHIECSAMGNCLLGECFDIHGGGADLIFPHHENEIAQSEAAYGRMPANYWLHNGFVRIDGEKMSKSLDNFLTIKDILKLYHPEVLRFFMLQFHYRSPVDFSPAALAEARTALNKCYRLLEALQNIAGTSDAPGDRAGTDATPPSSGQVEIVKEATLSLPARFIAAMDDDCNSAKAFGLIFDFVRTINTALADKKFLQSPEALPQLRAARHCFLDIGNTLGLFASDPECYFQEDKLREAEKLGLEIGAIESLVEERRQEREQKNWPRADEIRDKLAAQRVQIKDTPQGVSWFIE